MSRKWERMVRKNSNTVDKVRRKQGKTSIYQSAKDEQAVSYRGRSWLFPMLLISVGVFVFVSYRGLAGEDPYYWVTGAMYILLAAILFFWRRPFLRIGKQTITSRRFGGDRTMEASAIESIELSPNSVLFSFKNKRFWVFTKMNHLFPIAEMESTVIEFAQRNKIELKQKTKQARTGEKE